MSPMYNSVPLTPENRNDQGTDQPEVCGTLQFTNRLMNPAISKSLSGSVLDFDPDSDSDPDQNRATNPVPRDPPAIARLYGHNTYM